MKKVCHEESQIPKWDLTQRRRGEEVTKNRALLFRVISISDFQ